MNLPSQGTPGPDHSAYEVVSPTTIEPKTKAATFAGAGSAAIVTPAVVQLIDELFYGGGPINVPVAYIGVIGLVVTGACTFAASYYARHVNRA